MSKSYTKKCDRCPETIQLSDRSGSWKAYEMGGKEHSCSKKNETGNYDISLEVFLKKLESIGISIDFEKLRNASI